MDPGVKYILEGSIFLECRNDVRVKALLYYHRFMEGIAPETVDLYLVSSTCILLSSKAENYYVDFDKLIEFFYCMSNMHKGRFVSGTSLDELFVSLKRCVIKMEQIILRKFVFQLTFPTAHQFVVGFLPTLFGKTSLITLGDRNHIARTIERFLNDFYTRRECVRFRAEYVALAAMQAALRVNGMLARGTHWPLSAGLTQPWYQFFDASLTPATMCVLEQLLFSVDLDQGSSSPSEEREVPVVPLPPLYFGSRSDPEVDMDEEEEDALEDLDEVDRDCLIVMANLLHKIGAGTQLDVQADDAISQKDAIMERVDQTGNETQTRVEKGSKTLVHEDKEDSRISEEGELMDTSDNVEKEPDEAVESKQDLQVHSGIKSVEKQNLRDINAECEDNSNKAVTGSKIPSEVSDGSRSVVGSDKSQVDSKFSLETSDKNLSNLKSEEQVNSKNTSETSDRNHPNIRSDTGQVESEIIPAVGEYVIESSSVHAKPNDTIEVSAEKFSGSDKGPVESKLSSSISNKKLSNIDSSEEWSTCDDEGNTSSSSQSFDDLEAVYRMTTAALEVADKSQNPSATKEKSLADLSDFLRRNSKKEKKNIFDYGPKKTTDESDDTEREDSDSEAEDRLSVDRAKKRQRPTKSKNYRKSSLEGHRNSGRSNRRTHRSTDTASIDYQSVRIKQERISDERANARNNPISQIGQRIEKAGIGPKRHFQIITLDDTDVEDDDAFSKIKVENSDEFTSKKIPERHGIRRPLRHAAREYSYSTVQANMKQERLDDDNIADPGIRHSSTEGTKQSINKRLGSDLKMATAVAEDSDETEVDEDRRSHNKMECDGETEDLLEKMSLVGDARESDYPSKKVKIEEDLFENPVEIYSDIVDVQPPVLERRDRSTERCVPSQSTIKDIRSESRKSRNLSQTIKTDIVPQTLNRPSDIEVIDLDSDSSIEDVNKANMASTKERRNSLQEGEILD